MICVTPESDSDQISVGNADDAMVSGRPATPNRCGIHTVKPASRTAVASATHAACLVCVNITVITPSGRKTRRHSVNVRRITSS